MNNHNQELFETIKKFKKIFKREFKFLPVENEENIISFENKFNIKIPNEYRWFLLNISKGILAKNEWGFDLLEQIDFNNYQHSEEYDPSVNFKLDKRILFYEPEDYDDYPCETDMVRDNKLNKESNYFYDGYKTGVIHISNEGCGTYSMLVVNGNEYGNVWTNDIASNGEVYPEYDKENKKKRLNFIEWIIMIMQSQIKSHYLHLASEKRTIELKKESGEWDIFDQFLYSLKTLWNKIIN